MSSSFAKASDAFKSLLEEGPSTASSKNLDFLSNQPATTPVKTSATTSEIKISRSMIVRAGIFLLVLGIVGVVVWRMIVITKPSNSNLSLSEDVPVSGVISGFGAEAAGQKPVEHQSHTQQPTEPSNQNQQVSSRAARGKPPLF